MRFNRLLRRTRIVVSIIADVVSIAFAVVMVLIVLWVLDMMFGLGLGK